MSDDDPFAEPTDTDKTIVNLRPGGRPPAAPPPASEPMAAPPPQAPAAQPRPAGGPQVVDVKQAGTGMNPLNAAASPLFALVGRIRNRAQHNNPETLRSSVVSEI